MRKLFITLALFVFLYACPSPTAPTNDNQIGNWKVVSDTRGDWVGNRSFNKTSAGDTIKVNNPDKWDLWVSLDTLNNIEGRFFLFMRDSAYAEFPEFEELGVPDIVITTKDTSETRPIEVAGRSVRLRDYGLEIRYTYNYFGCNDTTRQTSDTLFASYYGRIPDPNDPTREVRGERIRTFVFDTDGMTQTLNEVACF